MQGGKFLNVHTGWEYFQENCDIFMRKLYAWALTALCAIFISENASAQSNIRQTLQTYLNENIETLGLGAQDAASWEITDDFTSRHNGVRHVHIRQTLNDIPVNNGVANFTLNTKGEVVHVGNRLVSNLGELAKNSSPRINAKTAIDAAANHVNMSGKAGAKLSSENDTEFIFEQGSLAQEDIKVSLAYWFTQEDVVLVWAVSLYEPGGEHWWQVMVNANTKAVVDKLDWVVSCDFGEPHTHVIKSTNGFAAKSPARVLKTTNVGLGSYNVFEFPVESPSHGSRSLANGPADSLSSPYGWHDTDGITGADFTNTRGNNVYAYTDVTNNNQPDFSPDGGPTLDFNFPLNLSNVSTTYQPAAVTNLFYANNRIHDIFYRYGFDETTGNFQSNNYGRGGSAGDYVLAEAQDGGGTNNANFATPPDGSSGRMQMYLWGSGGGAAGNLLTLNSPSGMAGSIIAEQATFGPALTTTPITANLAVVSDGSIDSTEGCNTLVNGGDINGKIAVVRRGNCAFTQKVLNAQTAGALGVIIVNNVAGIIAPGGNSPLVTIPSIMITAGAGQTLIDSLNAGVTINGSLALDTTSQSNIKDGDFDNGIIIHEYGHGISNRMTGGRLNSGCLGNAEQMGEGWSDIFGIILTMDTSSATVTRRPVGTFATGQPIATGIGIRPAPYDTNFAVNNFTYAATNNNNISQPHGIGFVWATMLWDLNWALINQYGYDSNIDSGFGGNNIALQLIVDGLALQSCNPGFVDGRDAILLADQLNNNGANECLIWKVFAKRGLGYSASQGSSFSRSDQVEAFDLPPACQIPVKTPVADFTSDVTATCQGIVNFTDLSIDVPQAWLWNFGDGTTDTTQNPTHLYSSAGTYNVSLAVYNTLGGDTLTKASLISVTIPNPPSAVVDGSGCSSDSIVLSAVGSATIGWFDTNGNLLNTGNTFKSAPSLSNTTYFARNGVVYPKNSVGPLDGSIGSGGYHGGNFTGTVNFDALKAVTIHSAWVDAGSAGPRTITLWEGSNGSGNVVQTITVNIPAGAGRIDLGFDVPVAGEYSIGLNQADLFRNNSGANYPYNVAGLISLTGSSAQSGGDFYYYFYDLEVSEAACWSDSLPVIANVTDTADFSFSNTNLTFNFTDLTPGSTSWAWDFGDGNVSAQQNPSHTYATPGVYTVTLTVNGGSCIVTYEVGAGVNIGLDDLEYEGFNIRLFPNPANEILNIALSEPLGYVSKARLYALNGKLIKEIEIGASDEFVLLPLNDVNTNLYVLEIDLNEGYFREKVTVMK